MNEEEMQCWGQPAEWFGFEETCLWGVICFPPLRNWGILLWGVFKQSSPPLQATLVFRGIPGQEGKELCL